MSRQYKARGNFVKGNPDGGQINYISFVDLNPEPDSPDSPLKTKNWVFTYFGLMEQGKIGAFGALKHDIDDYIYVGEF